jgi:tRNA pseudouridine38-40 synthase
MLLPKDIVVTNVRYVAHSLHPRFDAKRRVYLYNIFCGKAPLYMKEVVWSVADTLDIRAMRTAALVLKGTHDFSAFCASRSYADNKVRTIYRSELRVSPVADWLGGKRSGGKIITYQVEADAFLHHMIRNIVALLVDVGRGDLPISDVRKILKTKDRKQLPSATAPATGLVLYDVQYAGVTKKRSVK